MCVPQGRTDAGCPTPLLVAMKLGHWGCAIALIAAQASLAASFVHVPGGHTPAGQLHLPGLPRFPDRLVRVSVNVFRL